jgi:hypothetical protein
VSCESIIRPFILTPAFLIFIGEEYHLSQRVQHLNLRTGSHGR